MKFEPRVEMNNQVATRRTFLQKSVMLGGGVVGARVLPNYAWGGALKEHDLFIEEKPVIIASKEAMATTINGSVPGPLVRLKEGREACIRVTNRLKQDSSIHWHGLILPYQMDGVPGLSYDGIQSGQTFEYRFPVKQNGTYWYHSHSGLQEQTGVYGPLVIDAEEPEPFAYQREYVVLLSDWTFSDPHRLMSKLKKMADYSNFQQRVAGDFFRDVGRDGLRATLKERRSWSRMRMMATDIADVTGRHYTYLMNGLAAEGNWTGLFTRGETIRLRFINAAAMSYFDVRIPGLKMTVVQADGQNVRPVEVDEFRISVAETFDVLVTPDEDRAYTLFAETMDRSGYTRGTLAPRIGMSAAIPQRRKRALLSMRDMGMNHAEHEGDGPMPGEMSMGGHGNHQSMTEQKVKVAGQHGTLSVEPVPHGPDRHGPGNVSVASVSRSRLHEPGIGLEEATHRVLVYSDLKALTPWPDQRAPRREIELHLTGNMERYMWSFDGKKFSERTEPVRLVYGERVRLTFVNDTMMNHPLHLHGMWMVLDNGSGRDNPLKHTINVKPAERLSVDISADATGNWAFHCHLLFHMDMGMFRVVSVSKPTQSERKGKL